MTTATHDLLVVNTEASKDFFNAITEFRNTWAKEYIDHGNSEELMLDVGFEYGFWAAARILTGFNAEGEN